jgi:hypothetical protein
MPKRNLKPPAVPPAETANARHRPQAVASLLSPEQMEKVARERLERMERFETLWDPDQGAESFLPNLRRLGRILVNLDFFLTDNPMLGDLDFLDRLLAGYFDCGGGDELDTIALKVIAENDPTMIAVAARRFAEDPPPELSPILAPVPQAEVASEPDPEEPEWVRETPEECEYSLSMLDTDGSYPQDVTLTRTEFITLKERLAELRGLSAILAA